MSNPTPHSPCTQALDLKTLGFVPPESGDPQEIGLVEPLSNILKQLLGGGGAAKVNIDKVGHVCDTHAYAHATQYFGMLGVTARSC